MNESKNPEMRKQEREQLVELGSDLTSTGGSNIYTYHYRPNRRPPGCAGNGENHKI